jgi:hypothetical protein
MKSTVRTYTARLRDWIKKYGAQRFLILFLLGGLIVFANAVRAQELLTSTKTPTVEPQTPNDAQQPQAAPSTETKAEEKAEGKKEREEKIKKLLHG